MAEEDGLLGLQLLPPFFHKTHNMTEQGERSKDTGPNTTVQQNLNDHKQTIVTVDVQGALTH